VVVEQHHGTLGVNSMLLPINLGEVFKICASNVDDVPCSKRFGTEHVRTYEIKTAEKKRGNIYILIYLYGIHIVPSFFGSSIGSIKTIGKFGPSNLLTNFAVKPLKTPLSM